MSRPGLRRWLVAGSIAAVVVTTGIVTTVVADASSKGCRATYAVTTQSPGRFTASVEVHNLGQAVSPWKIGWVFPSGQRMTNGWGGSFQQTGSAVSVTGASRAKLRTNRSVTVRFSGTWESVNTEPSVYTLNGATCSVQTSPSTVSPAPATSAAGQPAPAQPSPAGTPEPMATSASPATVATSAAASRTPSVAPTVGPTTAWGPPANLASQLAQVWSHEEGTYNNGNLYGFKNYAWDQIMATGGSLNYCVRWDTDAPATAAMRDLVQTALQRQVTKWIDQLTQDGAGWNGWPYASVPVKVVGWAVRDRSTLQWSDNSVDIYVNDIREDAPQCAQPCGRFFNQSGNYPNCPGGLAHHYDMSLWLTSGFSGGAGGDWGQRVGSEYFMGAVTTDDIHIVQHELGHSFGLDDFYDWTPSGVGGFLMKSGSATKITEFDKWMLRDWWRHLRSRYV